MPAARFACLAALVRHFHSNNSYNKKYFESAKKITVYKIWEVKLTSNVGTVLFFKNIVTNVHYELTDHYSWQLTDDWLYSLWQFLKTPKRTDVYERYRLRIGRELRAIRVINTRVVRESVWIIVNKRCGSFIKPPDFWFRNNCYEIRNQVSRCLKFIILI